MNAPAGVIALPQSGWSLRRWRPEDAPRLQTLADDSRIAVWMSDAWPMPYTAADAAWWCGPGHAETGDNWAICWQDEPQGGCGGGQQTGWQRCNVEIGWWLNPAHWGQGLATQAARLCVEQAFAKPEVSRVFAPVHAGNMRSMRVAEKAGLRLEAVQPLSAYKQGRLITRHVFAIYREPPHESAHPHPAQL